MKAHVDTLEIHRNTDSTTKSLRDHCSETQGHTKRAVTTYGAPPKRGGRHDRVRTDAPPPHDAEHPDHELQSEYAPSTGTGATSQRLPVYPVLHKHTPLKQLPLPHAIWAHRSTGVEITDESTLSEFSSDAVSPAPRELFNIAADCAPRLVMAAAKLLVSSWYGATVSVHVLPVLLVEDRVTAPRTSYT